MQSIAGLCSCARAAIRRELRPLWRGLLCRKSVRAGDHLYAQRFCGVAGVRANALAGKCRGATLRADGESLAFAGASDGGFRLGVRSDMAFQRARRLVGELQRGDSFCVGSDEAKSLAPLFEARADWRWLWIGKLLSLPAAYEQRWVNISQVLSSGLLPSQNFLYTLIEDPEHNAFNWIASNVAILLIVLTGVAGLAARRKAIREQETGESEKLWRVLMLLAAAATVLMIRVSSVFWTYLPKLRFVQFPWRWMVILAVPYAYFLAAACRGGVGDGFGRGGAAVSWRNGQRSRSKNLVGFRRYPGVAGSAGERSGL